MGRGTKDPRRRSATPEKRKVVTQNTHRHGGRGGRAGEEKRVRRRDGQRSTRSKRQTDGKTRTSTDRNKKEKRKWL